MNNQKLNQAWHEDIIAHKMPHRTPAQARHYSALLEMADKTIDIDVVKTLFKTASDGDTGGIAQSLYGTLSTIEYELYYQAYCDVLEEFLDSAPVAATECLVHSARKFTPKEVMYLSDFIKKRISKKLKNKLIAAVRKCTIGEFSDNYPYNLFLEYLSSP